jgi:hypothetical protein
MPKLILLLAIFLMVSPMTDVQAVDVDEDNEFVIVTTANYEVHWGKLTIRQG